MNSAQILERRGQRRARTGVRRSVNPVNHAGRRFYIELKRSTT
jgi:hypothetical protein